MIWSVQKKNHIQPHEKCQTFHWLVIITLSETFHTKVNDILVRRSFSYSLCISVWIWCLCIYIFLNIFILRKWRRNIRILFWFEGLVWDFHCFHSHFTLKRKELGQQDQSKFFIFNHWKMGNWVSFHASLLLCGECVCVCVWDGLMYASIRQPLLLKQPENFHTPPI